MSQTVPFLQQLNEFIKEELLSFNIHNLRQKYEAQHYFAVYREMLRKL